MIATHYETDDKSFPADAYRIDGHSGIAWSVWGWETQPDEDTEWSGYEVRTGQIVAVMVGDDRCWTFDPQDAHPIDELDYCSECGQIGCCHDGRDRSEGGGV